jgi:hypothetical protein
MNPGRGRDAAVAKRPHRVAGEAADHLHGRHMPCGPARAARGWLLRGEPAARYVAPDHPRCSAASNPPASREGAGLSHLTIEARG